MSTAAPIRWGLLGTGRITAKLLAGVAASESARAVAVGSRSAEIARAFADANGIERVHGSYEALLADDQVDAVETGLAEGSGETVHGLASRWARVQRRYEMTIAIVMRSSTTEIAAPRPKSPSCIAWV